MDSTTASAPAPKKSRLPFKRAQRKASPERKEGAEENKEWSFFAHSKELFAEIVRENQEAVLKNQKATGNNLRRSSSTMGGSPDQRPAQDYKRRKVSQERESVDPPTRDSSTKRLSTPSSSIQGKSAVPILDSGDDDLIMDVKGKGKEVISTRTMRTPDSGSSRRYSTRTQAPIVLDDDDDEKAPGSPSQLLNSRSRRMASPPMRTYDDEDDDIVILHNGANNTAQELGSDDDLEIQDDEPPEFASYVQKARELKQKAQEEEQPITLYLTSDIPGTKPFACRRKVTQNLERVMETWVARQRAIHFEISDQEASQLLMTWNGIKLWLTTTPLSLGIQIDANGCVIRKPGVDPEEYGDKGICLRVWTQELFDKFKKDRERKQKELMGQFGDENGGADDDVQVVAESKPKPKRAKFILRDKDGGEVKLKTAVDSSIEAIIAWFCEKRGIEDKSKVRLQLDGEDLVPESPINDYDIEVDDENHLDVYIS